MPHALDTKPVGNNASKLERGDIQVLGFQSILLRSYLLATLRTYKVHQGFFDNRLVVKIMEVLGGKLMSPEETANFVTAAHRHREKK